MRNVYILRSTFFEDCQHQSPVHLITWHRLSQSVVCEVPCYCYGKLHLRNCSFLWLQHMRYKCLLHSVRSCRTRSSVKHISAHASKIWFRGNGILCQLPNGVCSILSKEALFKESNFLVLEWVLCCKSRSCDLPWSWNSHIGPPEFWF